MKKIDELRRPVRISVSGLRRLIHETLDMNRDAFDVAMVTRMDNLLNDYAAENPESVNGEDVWFEWDVDNMRIDAIDEHFRLVARWHVKRTG